MQTTPTAIDSSPAVADIDNDGRVEVVIGVGSTMHAHQNGSVIAFDGATGRIEWAFDQGRDTASLWAGDLPIPDNWCEGTYATPAIGDVNGDGGLDVVFGSWDFYIWAVDGNGAPLAGFPVNNDDTVWSSAALFDIDNDGDMEIFIGGDSTPGGYVDHLGGIFRAIDYRGDRPVPLWERYANEVFHSSPAIGDINADGRFEVVVGMGNNWHIECGSRANPQCSPSDGSDHTKVWAFHVDDGTNVPGWPTRATDTVWAAPAIGDVDGDGQLEVVVGSYDRRVYVWNGDGSVQWIVQPEFPHPHLRNGRITGHPIIADLDGDGDQDVAVGTEVGLAILEGQTGVSLEAGLNWPDLTSFAISYESAPVVGILNGGRHLVTVGFDTPQHLTRVRAFRLPTVNVKDAWPTFRGNPLRTGSLETSDIYRPRDDNSSAEVCSVLFRFAHEAVPVVKSAEDNSILAKVNWEYNVEHQLCYLVLSDSAVAVLRSNASVLTGAQRREDTSAAERCHKAYNPRRGFAREPVPVVKTSDGQRVLATVRWGYNADFNLCYLVLDQEAITVLRLAANPPVPLPPPSPISVGTDHWCWLREDGTVDCWNNGYYEGEMPLGTTLAEGGRFKAVSASNHHDGGPLICGVHFDQTIACWRGSPVGRIADVPKGLFADVSVGTWHSCGLRVDQTIACWGDNHGGRADPPEGRFLTISAGVWHSCGLRVDQTIACWGDNHGGRADPPGGRFVAVSAKHQFYSCGLGLDRAITCWGQGSNWLGTPNGRFHSLSVGDGQVCGIKLDQSIACWGYHHNQMYPPDGLFSAVSVGGQHTCALRIDNTVLCWKVIGEGNRVVREFQ